MKYYIYAREASGDATLMMQQIAKASEHIGRSLGIEQETIFFEDHCSSDQKFPERTGGKALLANLERGDAVVVVTPQRITRNLDDLVSVLAMLADKGVEVINVSLYRD